MYFKRYIFFSIIFLVIVGAFVHMTTADEMFSVGLFGFSLSLPISFWIVVPPFLLLLASLSHFGFYAGIRALKNRRKDKDLQKCFDIAKNCVLQLSKPIDVKDKNLKLLHQLLSHSKVYVNSGFRLDNKEIDEILELIEKIQKGDFVDLSKLKLPNDNPYFLQNELNHIKKDTKYAEKVISSNAAQNLKEEAFEVVSLTIEKKKLDKITLPKTKTVVFNLLKRFKSSKNPLEFSNEEILSLCKEANFSEKEFLQLALILQENLEPDKLLEVAYFLQSKIDSACVLYLYINLELEKNQEAKEYLEQFEDKDLKEFRYFITLKEAGQKINPKEFFKIVI